MDFKTKLAFAFVAACLLSMSALGYFTHLWAEDSILTESRRQLSILAEDREVEVAAVFARWTDDVDRILERVQTADWTSVDLNQGREYAIDDISQILAEAESNNSELVRLDLIENPSPAFRDIDVSPPSSFDDLGDVEIQFSGLAIDAEQKIGLVFHAWIVRDGIRFGLLEAEFDGRALGSLLGHSAQIGDSGETLLLASASPGFVLPNADKNGYLLYGRTGIEDPGPNPSEPSEIGTAARRGRQATFVDLTDHRGRSIMAATRFLPEAGWGIVVKIDDAEARERSDQLLADMRTLGISLAAFAILGGTFLGFRLGAPLNKLVEDVDRIRHGELGLRLEVKGEDEVAFLAQSLNEFMDQLDRSSDLFQLGPLRVLVICDDPVDRQRLQELLQNWNMRPTLFDNGASAISAIERAQQEGTAPQLILLDDSLPEIKSGEFIDQLRSVSPAQPPIIMLSTSASDFDAMGIGGKAVGCVLPKPVVASHLMEAILDEMGVSESDIASSTDVFLKRTQPRKILLAEDSSLIQQVVIELLENWGHHVTLAENGRIALECVSRESFDLILMDLEMPEMGGLDATIAIRANEESDSRIPIIALTAESLPADRERCRAAGMDDFVSKPADPKVLYALINRYPAQVLDPDFAERTDDEIQVDWDAARSFTNGNDALLQELISIFLTESRDQIEAIRHGINHGDSELLVRNAHTLKSAALVFGATSLADTALAIELSGRRSELEEAHKLLEALELQTDGLNATLARGWARQKST